MTFGLVARWERRNADLFFAELLGRGTPRLPGRVEINLKHREALPGATIASYTLEHEHNCPQDLIEAAERKWGSRIPFTKPDHPLCK